ncbi:pyridoxal phosphate-dependent aminotransferase [Planosporangium flavigriseum]|uniref:Aminotransferase n=1 Tax=Planosporangium flavigriseum TaxID=373681 RepID=A0A8J3LHD2_9ACTN|nr:pyridoxal phosphate-dependent aminotransferase [Planosporangium flavigriseum]NJC64105.1 pyridoxal phosphate-dependent aminotransferase [Planosporangium flavigriseum]GIG72987.1 aminotransferase [Planosporangium flavigriseum]
MVTDPLVARMRPFGTTIFAEMSALAARTDSVNLGQGFPDTDGPPEMLEAAVRAIREGRNQYPPGPGIPELRAAIAAHQREFWGLGYDPDSEVLVTAGATEAIAAAVLALCESGDEVVCFEPYYDSYAASIALAGAVRRPVTLRPAPDGGYGFDPDELRAAFGPRTRVVLLNSPHNPTGKVFTADELALVASLCVEHDAVAVTDEVYEHLVFDGAHVPLAGLPGMRERTVQISSAGKTFSCTGWKVGWACGPAPLVSAVLRVKQFLTFVNAGPQQPAVAVALGLPRSYYDGFRDSLRDKRDRLCLGLSDAGFDVLRSDGTYFVTADITPLGGTDGVEFCRSLPERCGVVAVPTQVFYDDVSAGRQLIRFAFCKRDEVLDEAVARLRKLSDA